MKNLFGILLLTLSSTAAFAWGQTGHRIVAEICALNLNDNARKEVQAILGRNYLTQVATWPDFIRSEKSWDFTKSWHYISVDPGTTVREVLAESAKNESIDNVIEAIELMKGILKDNDAATQQFRLLMEENGVEPLNGSVKATALAFLIHFIGDIHQPLHVGRTEDYGGNAIKVGFFGESTNLHSVWDEGLIGREKLSFTEYADFINKHTEEEKSQLQKGTIEDWAEESIEVRKSIYADLETAKKDKSGKPDLSYQYQHDFIHSVEDRLGAGGVRAAGVLNALFS